MLRGNVIYCIDTSALMDAWIRYYSPDVFPSLWGNIDEMIEQRELISPEEVLFELEKKEDDLYQWAKNRKNMFKTLTAEIQLATNEILSAFPRLVEAGKDRTEADPFVIAVAKANDATFITSEKFSSKQKKVRIPVVCQHYNIKSINMLQLIREQGWKF